MGFEGWSAKSLKVWKAKADKTCSLVFPTAGYNPKFDFLDGRCHLLPLFCLSYSCEGAIAHPASFC